MGVRRLGAAVAAAAVLAVPIAASGAQKPAADVKAEGNPFTGGLAFTPKTVTVQAGQAVRWTNTDTSVPHTATEDHHLWNLTGTYGQPVASGFGPGESRQRAFEAGTHHYFCEVHPDAMRGVVRVPVVLAVKKLADGGRRVVMLWASRAPASGQVYDVQVRKGSGKWTAFRTGTREFSGKLTRHGAKVTVSVRARLRRLKPAAQTGWSPVKSVQA